MEQCIFCEIALGSVEAVTVYEDPEILAFLDTSPIRRGHTQIIPRQHFETFEELPFALAGQILSLGQRLALRLKELYQVDRVAFVFMGGDVAHAHAHVVPRRATSRRLATSSRQMSNRAQNICGCPTRH
jgi:histidine triad (HIT) family protein